MAPEHQSVYDNLSVIFYLSLNDKTYGKKSGKDI